MKVDNTWPAWLVGVEETRSTALIFRRGRDGSMVGYRVPPRSLLEAALERERAAESKTDDGAVARS